MVKNTKGGKRAKNLARKNIDVDRSLKFDDLVKTEDQEYAKVTKVNGGHRYNLNCYDKVNRLGISRGKINKGKVEIGTLVLISKRDYQDNKCDILHIYNSDELKLLVSNGEIDSNFAKNDTESTSTGDDSVEFGASTSSDEEDVKFEDL
jgi:translation initiation factor 1A